MSLEGLTLSPEESQSPDHLARLSPVLESLPTQEVVAWAVGQYSSGLVLASSFGAEDMVLIDMLARTTSNAVVFYLDTDLLFPETYQLIQRVKEHYPLEVVRVATELTLDEQAGQYGQALWLTNPNRCCELRKVIPLQPYLQGKRAWMTGIRRDQTLYRRHAPLLTYDAAYGLAKINPLVNWTYRQVFGYLVRHQVPYNPLHDHGYPSIGCVPCTRAIRAGEDQRAGRWAGQEKTECGLHL